VIRNDRHPLADLRGAGAVCDANLAKLFAAADDSGLGILDEIPIAEIKLGGVAVTGKRLCSRVDDDLVRHRVADDSAAESYRLKDAHKRRSTKRDAADTTPKNIKA